MEQNNLTKDQEDRILKIFKSFHWFLFGQMFVWLVLVVLANFLCFFLNLYFVKSSMFCAFTGFINGFMIGIYISNAVKARYQKTLSEMEEIKNESGKP